VRADERGRTTATGTSRAGVAGAVDVAAGAGESPLGTDDGEAVDPDGSDGDDGVAGSDGSIEDVVSAGSEVGRRRVRTLTMDATRGRRTGIRAYTELHAIEVRGA
jgi:hypothetical protein